MKRAVLAVDQGTTSTRASVFDGKARRVATAQQEFVRSYPQDGWVEQDPEDLWSTTRATCLEALKSAADDGYSVEAMGITNQRETVVAWDRATGQALGPAIVWQDRRTAQFCQQLKSAGHEPDVTRRTGLLLDPYFSATKIRWILDNHPEAARLAAKGQLAVGTVDSFLVWRLTGGQRFVTDATNASRTLLFNLETLSWDAELLRLFDIPESILPQVLDCNSNFGVASLDGNEIPILGVAGDQHAASIGQCCFHEGDIKSTYGTGCFVMMNTGDAPVRSQHRLLTTLCYQLDGKPTYALEGSIFTAGAAVQWLRDGLGLVSSAAETEVICESIADNHGVYLVPAFTGLGAPHWDPDARGLICGLTMDAGPKHFVRATLESVAFQTHDLLAAMAEDGIRPERLRVDGGMVQNNWFCGFLSDLLALPVSRPVNMETTVLGAASLAGVASGLYPGFDELEALWHEDRAFTPDMESAARETLLTGWNKAVARTLMQ